MRRFLFYAHDGPGLGPVRRALAVARALTEAAVDASILVVTSAEEVESLGLPPRVGVLRLPGPYAADQKVLAAAVEIFRPEIVLVDTHPFGSEGELGPALEIVRAAGAGAVLALPDVIDEPGAVGLEWRTRGFYERIPESYDRVLVYGQPDLLDPVRDCGFPAGIAAITSFCGYVVSSSPGDGATAARSRASAVTLRPARVLATAGESDDGFPVLEAFVEAAAVAGWQATVVAGSRAQSQRLEMLRTNAADTGISFRDFVPSLPSELSSLDALVCMGGYNTLAEAAASGVPTVCTPRVEPMRDQLIRARAFSSRGLLRVVEPGLLTPELLRTEVEGALAAGPSPVGTRLDLGGSRRAAHHLLELAARHWIREPTERGVAEATLQLSVPAGVRL